MRDDVLMMTSKSGETDEVIDLDLESLTKMNEAMSDSKLVVLGMLEELDSVTMSTLNFDEFLEHRARMGTLHGELDKHAGSVSIQLGFTDAKSRIRQYLLNHLGQVIDKYQVAGAGCVMEWARRKRELVVEEGWNIASGPGASGLKPGQYRLDSDVPDDSAAARWKLMNSVRRQPGSAMERMLAVLKAIHPESVSRDELNYVAQIGSRDRRKRDLDEAGWDISSHDDDPSLPSGHYRLNSLTQGPARTREAIKERQKILVARNFTCEQCGRSTEKGQNPLFLQVHHIRFVSQHGPNQESNYRLLCRSCHAGIHALAETQVEDELLNPAADPPLLRTREPD